MRGIGNHPARLDDADRRRHTRNPVPLLIGILAVIVVMSVMALLDAQGIER